MDKTAKTMVASFLGDAALFLGGCVALVVAATCLAFTGALCARIAVICWHVFFH
jgi:hypothetical protein